MKGILNFKSYIHVCVPTAYVYSINDFTISFFKDFSTIFNVSVKLGRWNVICHSPGPEFIKLFSCSIQLSMAFIMLINIKMPTIVGILIFMSMINTTSGHLKARKTFIF